MPKKRQADDRGRYHQPVPHIPVLSSEVLTVLSPKSWEAYLDATAGYGGHAEQVLQLTHTPQKAVLIDRDPRAADYLKQKFAGSGAKIIKADFLSASMKLAEQGEKFDLILADLGTSSPHLDEPSRGFSFATAGPLDMRMDTNQDLSAETVVNEWDEPKLTAVIGDYGEERQARKIARAIITARPIRSTAQLAEVIAGASRPPSNRLRRKKIHPATRSFQAIRIAVNDELAQLEQSMPIWKELLAPNGRLAIISFHSLEDRLVKRFFAEHAGRTYDAELTVLTKKPVIAKPDEIDRNPRARSAKLRAAAKNKNSPAKN